MAYRLLTLALLVGCSGIPRNKSEINYNSSRLKRSWTKNIDNSGPGEMGIALASPLIHDGVMYVPSMSGTFYALDVKTGRTLWEKQENKKLTGTPTVIGDLVLYGSFYGRLFVRNRNTGNLEYSIDLGASIDQAPGVGRDIAYFHLRDHSLVALDYRAGKVLWKYRRSVAVATTIQRSSRPIVTSRAVMVGFADGNLVAFQPQDGQVLWEKMLARGSKFIDVDMTPLLHKGRIYVGAVDQNLHILQQGSGATFREVAVRSLEAPIVVPGGLAVGTTKGEMVKIDVDGNVRKRLKVSKHGFSRLKRFQEVLVAVDFSGRVFLVDQEMENVIESFHLGTAASAVFGEVTGTEQILALLSSRGRLYVFN